jgi:hypothetical protein
MLNYWRASTYKCPCQIRLILPSRAHQSSTGVSVACVLVSTSMISRRNKLAMEILFMLYVHQVIVLPGILRYRSRRA